MRYILLFLILLCFPVLGTDESEVHGIYLSKFAAQSTNSSQENANLDCSSGCIWKIQPPDGELWVIARLLIQIEDDTTIDTEEYGGLSALTNGVSVRYTQDGVTDTITNSLPVKTNEDWARFSYDVTKSDYGTGSPNEFSAFANQFTYTAFIVNNILELSMAIGFLLTVTLFVKYRT